MRVWMSVRNLLTGRAWGTPDSYRFPVWCSAESWRCTRCNKGMGGPGGPEMDNYWHKCDASAPLYPGGAVTRRMAVRRSRRWLS